MVMVHIRNRPGIFAKSVHQKNTLESRLKYLSTFAVLFLIIVGQKDSQNEEKSDTRIQENFKIGHLFIISCFTGL